MKLNLRLWLLGFVMVCFSCGSDDDNDPYSGIPSGKIVELDERESMLMGTDEQKWWKHLNGQFRYVGTCTEDTESFNVASTYYGFYSSNQLFLREGMNEQPFLVGSWQWENANTKNTLLINYWELKGLKLELRALNDEQLVYLSEEIDGDCTQLIWEELGEPFSE